MVGPTNLTRLAILFFSSLQPALRTLSSAFRPARRTTCTRSSTIPSLSPSPARFSSVLLPSSKLQLLNCTHGLTFLLLKLDSPQRELEMDGGQGEPRSTLWQRARKDEMEESRTERVVETTRVNDRILARMKVHRLVQCQSDHSGRTRLDLYTAKV